MSAWREVEVSVAGARGRLLDAMRRPAITQQQVLQTILRANRETAFGRRYGFDSICSESQYRERVPLHRYEDLAPVECANPIAFETTGGSTAGPKLIPYTAPGLAAFRQALSAWLDDLLEARPGIRLGRMYWSISPAARAPRSGLTSDATYFGDSLGASLTELLAVPPEIAGKQDFREWKECTAQCLRRAHDLTLISVWSPTFLLELVRSMGERPAWPRLDTISCWTSASAASFVPELRELFPHAYIQGKGLLATEGVVTVPLAGWPHPVLAIQSGFFEFLDDHGESRLCHDLQEGCEYRVVLTTHSGLYRYDLQDRVRMQGWAENAPMLEFLGRAGVVSDLVGEKLTEEFVLARLRGASGFAMLAPERRHYVLWLDAARYDEASAADLAARLDKALRDNPQYDYARRLGQLGPIVPRRVHGPMELYCETQLRAGRRLGDIKPPALSREAMQWNV